jgi:hypothetical protein
MYILFWAGYTLLVIRDARYGENQNFGREQTEKQNWEYWEFIDFYISKLARLFVYYPYAAHT